MFVYAKGTWCCTIIAPHLIIVQTGRDGLALEPVMPSSVTTVVSGLGTRTQTMRHYTSYNPSSPQS